MAHFMQKALLSLFAPRPPLTFKPPPQKRPLPPLAGVADFMKFSANPPLPVKHETPNERKERRKKQAGERAAKRIVLHKKKWNPPKDANIKSDAYKTLFVARVSYEVDEEELRSEFEHYGDVKSVRIVKKKKDGSSRGYAFVEFYKGSDLKAAFRRADGRKLSGRRIVVDVERGRTVKNWLPRKLGGGLGGTRRGAKDTNSRGSGREGPRDERDDEYRRKRDRSRERGRDRGDRDRGDRDRGDRGDRDRGRRDSHRSRDDRPPREPREDRSRDRRR